MKVVIVGAGGHGAVVADILLRMREAGDRIEIVALVDDDPAFTGRRILSIRVVPGGLAALTTIEHDAVIVAVGNNAARRDISDRLRRSGRMLAIARHPASVVAPDVDIGPGTVVCAGVVVNTSTRIGWCAILNTHSSVDHHNDVGDYAHIAPGAHLAGHVSIGDEALIGMGSVVLSGRRIGRRATVGAGSVVTRDLPAGVLALGAPARVRRKTEFRTPLPLSASLGN